MRESNLNITAFFIRRPAFTIVISLMMVIVGVLSYLHLPLRWIPNINPPEVTVMTMYNGANARIVEKDITKVIEEAMSGVNGIESMSSSTYQGFSRVHIRFKLGRNMDAATEDVRSSIERIRDSLPRDAGSPLVMKADPDSNPIMYIMFYDENRIDSEVSDYVDKFIVPVFETMDGVGSVGVFGRRSTAMRIWLDPAKMAATRITVNDVVDLIREQNASIPSGQIRSQDRFYNITTNTELNGAEDFNNLILRGGQAQMTRLKDIGEARLDPESIDDAFRVQGHTAIAIGIVPQSTANPLDIDNKVLAAFKNISKSLPAGMKAGIIYNQADYIRASIKSVYESFFEAVLFVWLVILVFLCSFRATLIPVITIPVCLISTFAILSFFGFTINTITLMAFVLAIGLVVDDAIVMLENISRHIEGGMNTFQAALRGGREMIFPIIAMTLTLAAVYAPIAFTPGLLGVIFLEFAFTLAGAVMISGIVALTLSPMMCARILSDNRHRNRYAVWFTAKMEHLQFYYQKLLRYLLAKRNWVTGGLLLVGLLGLSLYHYLPSELSPQEDRGEINVSISAPRGSSFQYTDKYVRQLEKVFDSNPDMASYFSVSGMHSPSHAYQEIQLKPKSQRKHSTNEIIASLNAQVSSLTGVNAVVFPSQPPLAEITGSDSGDNIGLVVMTTGDYRHLQQMSQNLINELRKYPQFARVDNKLKWDGEEFEINIDRNKAADLNVPVSSIASTISTMIASRSIGKSGDANIIVQMNRPSLADPNIFSQLYVRNLDGNVIPLSQFASVKTISAPEVFHRYMRLHADTIYISLAPGIKISDAIQLLTHAAKNNLPEDARFEFTGEAKSFLESNGAALTTFGLALLFIYLVLVAQFESFIDPFIILLTVPFAVFGALVTLLLFGGSLNVYSNIGLITLIGLIAKHGILITEFANRIREEGVDVYEAVIRSCQLRLRPILMTTSAMVLGALPLALAFGPGSETRQQIGLVIAGGLLFGTIFSLIVIPIMYTYLAPFKRITVDNQNEGQVNVSTL